MSVGLVSSPRSQTDIGIASSVCVIRLAGFVYTSRSQLSHRRPFGVPALPRPHAFCLNLSRLIERYVMVVTGDFNSKMDYLVETGRYIKGPFAV